MTSKLFIAVATIVLFSALIAVQKPFNAELRQMEAVPITDAVGPESVAFDPLGDGPYVGVSDGRIIKWQENEHRWIDFGTTSRNREGCLGQEEQICGRPLGICFSEATADLYIADAYMGLLRLGPQGGFATPIATHADAIPFRFTNSLDINQSDGSIYFTDSSSLFQRRNYISVILSGDKTGRLLKYEQGSQQVTVLLTNLSFPNGVALSKDGSFLVFSDTTNCRILRVKIVTWILSCPKLGRGLIWLVPVEVITRAYSVLLKLRGSGMAMRISEEGEVLETLELKMSSMSEVQEKGDHLWIGSINLPFLGRYRL
ncbi:hypothetical protein V6N13_125953 [Hibiscus sabdariffa]|uniref:Strictosidine synthase conserved region domain-containing protein n=1 Tax=Hibiscus sabdariffa TaxID=183260 RepID=A0ABR2NWW6_9ROSI